MANSMVIGLNLRSTVARQDSKCLDCGKELNLDRVYFRMDQEAKPEIYEVYCEKCGLKWEVKDNEKRN